MATLTGNTIKDTYKSLIKVNDNGELAASLQEITDGYGNGSGVSLNTAGDLKAEGTIEFGSIKDTGEDITISKFVDEADGIANNDNDTSIPTSAAIIDYVASRITLEDLDFAGDTGTGSVDLDSQTFTISGTTNQIETTASGQSVTFAFPSAGVVLPDGSTATTQATTDDSTKVATTAYVKSVLTQEDLDFQGDTGTGSVDLDSQVLDIAGGTGIDTAASGQTLTVNIDSTVATLTGTQTLTNKSIDLTDNTLTGTLAEFNAALSDDDFTSLTGAETLTNKTIDADSNTISNLEVDNLKSGVLDTDLTTVSTLDDTLASAKAIKTYVDANITAQDLDITDGTITSAVDLDSQTMTIQGTSGEVEVSLTDQTFTVGLPDTINVNVTGAITGNADTASALETARDIELSGDVAGSASFDGSANITITTTIQADSVALGTDTTGDYVANLGTGTGVTIASNTGEGSQPTISVDYGSTANTAVEGDTEITINGTTNQIKITGTANQALGGAPSYTIGLPDDVTIGGSLIVSDNLTVNGTTTTVNTQTLSVEDPLIALAIANDANSVDTGFYAKYSLDAGVTTKFAGLFKDASDTDTFKLFKGLEVEPTTTVNTAGTGYALADLQVAGLEASTITKTGGASTEFLKADGSVDSNTYLTAESDTLDAVTTRGNTTSNSIEVGAATVTGDLTVDTNTLYVDSADNRVGIGTLDPQVNLQVEGTIMNYRSRYSTNQGTSYWDIRRDSSTGNFVISDDGLGDVIEISQTNGNVAFDTNTLYVDAANNRVGIGTTSPFTNLTVYGATDSRIALINSNSGTTSSDGFVMILEDDSEVNFLNRESAAIKFATAGTERMRIDSSGNLLLKGTGITSLLKFDSSSYGQILSTGGTLYYDVDTQIFRSSAGTERMRIDSSGNVGIGTTSPNSNLHISSAGSTILNVEATGANDSRVRITAGNANISYIEFADPDDVDTGEIRYEHATNNMQFRTNGNVERMRITSGGGVEISAGGLTAGTITVGRNGNFSSLGAVSDGNGTTTAFLNGYSTASGTSNAIIYTNGTYGSRTNTYGGIISDQRYKENIIDASPKLDKIMQVKVRNFNLIGDDLKQIGVIAQEVEQVFPSLVYERELTENVETVDEEGNVTSEIKPTGETAKAVKDSIFTYILLKAVQEQQEIINDLKARIEVLESN